MAITKRFGWIPSPYGQFPKFIPLVPNPVELDLRLLHSQVFDQGNLGSASANAVSTAFQFCLKKQRKTMFTPSRMFLYYNTREIDQTLPYDTGTSIRQTINVAKSVGVCSEQSWNYNAKSFMVKPQQKSYGEAIKHTVLTHQFIRQNLNDLKAALNLGLPVIFGFVVYNSFLANSLLTGQMNMPIQMDYVVGSQTATVVGYNDKAKIFIVQNSWGTSWGDKGYFYMPYSYITHPNLAMDFWQVLTVSG